MQYISLVTFLGKIKYFIVLVLIICLLCSACNTQVDYVPLVNNERDIVFTERENELWKKTVRNYLSQPLWTESEAYDAGHHLMIPLHAAYKTSNTQYLEDIKAHINSFLEIIENQDSEIVSGRLNKLHYLYFVSQYIKLSAQYDPDTKISDDLFDYIYEFINDIWVSEPAWQWEMSDFKNMKERVLWKLDQNSTKPSYLKMIIDEELFTFAIAADLQYYCNRNEKNKYMPLLNEISEIAYKVFQQEGRFDSEARWLFQPGVVSEHPDHSYAIYEKPEPNMLPVVIPDLPWDASHSHRFPLWLNSLADASDSKRKHALYTNILNGFNEQFFNIVVEEPTDTYPYYRTKNYMDGHNGLYRYAYTTTKQGYGPYELSGTISLGWWSFLYSDESQSMYIYLAENPLLEEAIQVYVGPNTTRERNPLTTLPDFYYNGFAELTARLASKL